MMEIEADVAILGSGFAGSLSALVLNRLGLRAVLVDKAVHPRFAIGESSTPIADMILRDLSDAYDLPRLKPLSTYGTWQDTYPHLVAGRKRGFSYFHHRPGTAFAPDAAHTNELLVAASSDDYHSDTHWLRADVDAFFAEEVRRAGIPFLENTLLTVQRRDGCWHGTGHCGDEPVHVGAGFLLDASGAAGVVPRALGLADRSAALHTHSRALYAHFTGVRRWHDVMAARGGRTADHPYYCDDAALHHLLDGAWTWLLRFNNDVVSAGVVLDARRYPLDPDVSPEDEWRDWLRRYPSLAEQFAAARLVEPPGRLIRTGRLQRMAASVAGSDWALLPHTAGFIDPLHSTGIAHSLCGVERLMRAFARYGQQERFAAALQDYEQAVLRELAFIDTLVAACYAAFGDFRLFSAVTMLYFAASITYERERAARRARQAPADFDRLFLCADEEALRSAATEALARLSTWWSVGTVQPSETAALEQFVEDAIRPFNTAGLFHAAVPNMYHHTAAPL